MQPCSVLQRENVSNHKRMCSNMVQKDLNRSELFGSFSGAIRKQLAPFPYGRILVLVISKLMVACIGYRLMQTGGYWRPYLSRSLLP